MGLLDKLRGELIDIIEWIDDTRHTLVWRFPRHQNEIKHGANLIVRPGQVAVFVRNGRIADVFHPGTTRLTTRNLPLLASLMGWARGFNSPFRAEVYFVSTRQVTELKWGTPNPVILRDPDFGPIRLRAFGTYALQATDATAIVSELVGTDGSFDTEEITHLVRSTITSTFADVVGKSRIPALDLASHYLELAEEVRSSSVDRLGREYGLQVPALFILNISFPEDVEKALDRRTSMELIGNMAAYQQYQMGTAMVAAAENTAEGSGASAGLGLGVGMGMAQGFGNSNLHASTGLRPPPMPLSPPPLQWHVTAGSESWGPVTEEQLSQWMSEGRIPLSALVWAPGLADWTPIERVGALTNSKALTPPPIPKGLPKPKGSPKPRKLTKADSKEPEPGSESEKSTKKAPSKKKSKTVRKVSSKPSTKAKAASADEVTENALSNQKDDSNPIEGPSDSDQTQS